MFMQLVGDMCGIVQSCESVAKEANLKAKGISRIRFGACRVHGLIAKGA